ncbi:MAG: hypothetical protein KIT84_10640 [Labilithrix sp.]|nr:hypothetical protein [Labilithrix sp.]MCW5811463.1 hypothetical protein [Labilithrix sp.]
MSVATPLFFACTESETGGVDPDAGVDGGVEAEAGLGGCLEITEDVRADTVWEKRMTDPDAADAPDVCVRGTITVQGVHLTIAAGVRVEFGPAASLRVSSAEGSALTAEGTAEKRITLYGSSAEPGWWDGLEIESADPRNKLAHILIRDAGGGRSVTADDTLGRQQAAIVLDAEPGRPAEASLRDITFEDNAGWGLIVEGISDASALANLGFVRNADGAAILSQRNVHKIDNFTFEGNGFDGVAITSIVNLELPSAVTWKALGGGAKYWVRESLTFLTSLTIEPGAKFQLAAGTALSFPQNASNTRAEVVIVGTAENKISFEGEQAVAGHWEGIEVTTGHAANKIHHAEIGHAVKGIRLRKAGAFPGAVLDVANTRIHDSSACGIENTSTTDNTLTTTNVTFENNAADNCTP